MISSILNIENTPTPAVSENPIRVNYLVFTRFEDQQLDYKFYFTTPDENLTEKIKNNLIPSNEDDSELPYEAFFIYENYCVLCIADLWLDKDGRKRKDDVGRDISRRIFLIWKISEELRWLKYEHLLVFLHYIRKFTKDNLDTIPNDDKEGKTLILTEEFNRTYIENLSDKLVERYEIDYSKFLEQYLMYVRSKNANIEVPPDWTIDKQFLLLKGFSIFDTTYFIWQKPFKKIASRFEKLLNNNRWIVLNDKDNYISFLHSARGTLVGELYVDEEIAKIQNANVTHNSGSLEENKTSEIIEPKEETAEVIEEVPNKEEVTDTEENLSDEKTEEDSPANPDGAIENSNSDIHSYELSDIEMIINVDALRKDVCFLICTANEFNPSILDSWNNVLSEIRSHHINSSRKQKKEWIRRLDVIREIFEEKINLDEDERKSFEHSFILLELRLFELMENE